MFSLRDDIVEQIQVYSSTFEGYLELIGNWKAHYKREYNQRDDENFHVMLENIFIQKESE